MSEVTIQELEDRRDELKTLVARREQALKLRSNREFNSLILKGFCESECAAYARQSGDPALTPTQRQDALNMSQAAGHLLRFLSVTVQKGNVAERDIEDCENAILEINQEKGGD